MWIPNRKKPTSYKKEKTPPKEQKTADLRKPTLFVCDNCGQMAFEDMDKCGYCKKPFKSKPKKQKKPAKKKPSRRRNMNFDEFEKSKRQLNKFTYQLGEALDSDQAPKAEIKELESKISALRQKLEDNIHLAFIFNYE